MKAITVGEIDGVGVGHHTDEVALTGCTAVVFPGGAVGAHVVRGVATGSRELEAFTPRHLVERVHAICLSGGSAFGLAAASGVARCLEEAGVGHETSSGRVPIVGGAVVYDLNLGDGRVRPTEEDGHRAAAGALASAGRGAPARSGCVGAGTGVSAGKVLGISCATKTGLGNSGVLTDEGLAVAALVVANPVGDVVDPRSGRILAGARRAPASLELVGTAALMRGGARCEPLTPGTATTLCVVCTNARLSRVEAAWVAEQAAAGIARGVDPPFTRHDGDIVFVAAVGGVEAEIHRVGVLALDATSAALVDACTSARGAGGLPSCHTLAPG
jgi:L-aminopeptidase/D-esterase-like protein